MKVVPARPDDINALRGPFPLRKVIYHRGSLAKSLVIQFQDTAGQERYRTITTAYYRGAMGFILMYDVTNEESFSSVHDW